MKALSADNAVSSEGVLKRRIFLNEERHACNACPTVICIGIEIKTSIVLIYT